MLLSDVRQIGRVALPLYLSMVAVSVSALVNTAALGRYGTGALAAFAVTVAVYFPAVAAVSGAVRGVLPFMRTDDPGRVVRDGAWLAVFVGVLGAAAVACVPLIARASGVPAETVEQLGAFPALMAVALLCNGFGSMATSGLIGLGQSKVVLRAGLLGAACTALLSPVLVGKIGLNGAGVAMCVANLASCVITVLGLRRRLEGPPDWRIHGRHVVELAKVGLPMAGTVLVKFAVLGVLAIAAARVSATAAAAHNIATGLVSLTFTAAVAVGQAVVPVVSARSGREDVLDPRLERAPGFALQPGDPLVDHRHAGMHAVHPAAGKRRGDRKRVAGLLAGFADGEGSGARRFAARHGDRRLAATRQKRLREFSHVCGSISNRRPDFPANSAAAGGCNGPEGRAR